MSFATQMSITTQINNVDNDANVNWKILAGRPARLENSAFCVLCVLCAVCVLCRCVLCVCAPVGRKFSGTYCECTDAYMQLYMQPFRGSYIMYVEVGPSPATCTKNNSKSTKFSKSRN
jgi:hypothetical protein